MAKMRRVTGIYVPIQLDTSQFERDLERIKFQVGDTATAFMKAFDGTLSSKNLIKGFSDVISSLGRLRDAANSFQHMEPLGALERTLEYMTPEVKQLADALGITADEQKNLLTMMANNTAIQQQVQGLNQLQRALGVSKEELIALTESMNINVSAEALQRFTGEIIDNGDKGKKALKDYAEEYTKLAALAGETFSPERQKAFVDRKKIEEAVNAFKQLNPQVQIGSQHYRQLAQAANVAEDAVRRYVEESRGASSVLNILFGRQANAQLQAALAVFKTSFSAYMFVDFMKGAVEATTKMDSLKTAFESIYGDATQAADAFKRVKSVSDELGLSLIHTADGAKKLFASAQGTQLEGEVDKVFRAFSSMGAALKLTGDEMDSVFLAISQSISKGKLTAEEMRSQLAERMPGAIQLLAKSIGVTTRQLDKMFEDGKVGLEYMIGFAEEVQKQYGAAAKAASGSLQSELNRVSNAWFELKASLIDSDTIASSVKRLADFLRNLASHADAIGDLAANFVKTAAALAGLAAAIKIATGAWTLYKAAAAEATVATKLATAAMGVLRGITTPLGAAIALTAVSVGTLMAAFYDGESETDKFFNSLTKLRDRAFDIDAALNDAADGAEKFSKRTADLTLDNMRQAMVNAQKDLQALFVALPSDAEKLLGNVPDIDFVEELGITPSKIETAMSRAFDAVSSKLDSEEQGELFKAMFKKGMALMEEFNKGAGSVPVKQLEEKFKDVLLVLQGFDLKMKSLGASTEAQKAITQLINLFGNAGEKIIKTTQALEDAERKMTEWGKSADISNQAFEHFNNLAKKTDDSAMRKLNSEMTVSADKLIELYTNAQLAFNIIEEGGDKLPQDQLLAMQNNVQNLNDGVALLAAAAVNSGWDWDTFRTKLEAAGESAKLTGKQIQELINIASTSFNFTIADTIQKELDKVDLKISQIGASKGATKTLKILSTVIKDINTQTAIQTALNDKNYNEVTRLAKERGVAEETVNAAIQKGIEFQKASEAMSKARSAGRASRHKQAVKQTSEAQNGVLELTKKIAALQAKYNDDPSIKYWAEVTGEIDKMNEVLKKAGSGTDAEKAKLGALVEEYRKVANARREQMAVEERWKKTQDATQKLGGSWGVLGEVDTRAPSRLIVENLNAQYEENLRDFTRLKDAKIITEQEFVDAVSRMEEELNIKTAAANDSWLASFTLRVKDATGTLRDMYNDINNVVINSINSMSDAMSDFLITGMKNTDDLAAAFNKMASSMIQELGRIFMRIMIYQALSSVFGAIFGGGAASYSPAQQATMSSNGMQAGYGGWLTGVRGHAKGAVFTGGDIGTFSGRVVKGPTLFSGTPKPFALGGNVMGEKGPEAVMPLRRGPDGRLGVDAKTSAPVVNMTQKINIDVQNNADAKVTAMQNTNANGDVDIKLMIERTVGEAMTRAGSAPFRALQNVWQGRTALADR